MMMHQIFWGKEDSTTNRKVERRHVILKNWKTIFSLKTIKSHLSIKTIKSHFMPTHKIRISRQTGNRVF